jgi:hypothetical protein
VNNLLTLPTRCPVCRRRPPIRINDVERERYTREEPDHIVMTYRCHCGEMYAVRAVDFCAAARSNARGH